jgi:dihydroxyacetone kinase-like protein
MKKLINDPDNIVEELIDGFVLTNIRKVKRISKKVVARIDAPIKGKVTIIIGGGAGHEPLFLEYIGKGVADAAAHGEVFTAPTPDTILDAIKSADGGDGVILLYNNYEGDVLNFDMAQEMAREDGIKVDTVLITDEISSAPKERLADRRGTTADRLVIKIGGGAAESGNDFDTVVRILKKAIYNSRSLGVSLSACTVPGTGLPTFDFEEGKMEFGMGVHGEAGARRVDLMTADATTERLLTAIVEDLPYIKGDEVIALVNSYGSTTRMEMFIIMRRIHSFLAEKGISVYASELGEFATVQEMAGISITLLKLDEELKKYYDAPADSPGFIKY